MNARHHGACGFALAGRPRGRAAAIARMGGRHAQRDHEAADVRAAPQARVLRRRAEVGEGTPRAACAARADGASRRARAGRCRRRGASGAGGALSRASRRDGARTAGHRGPARGGDRARACSPRDDGDRRFTGPAPAPAPLHPAPRRPGRARRRRRGWPRAPSGGAAVHGSRTHRSGRGRGRACACRPRRDPFSGAHPRRLPLLDARVVGRGPARRHPLAPRRRPPRRSHPLAGAPGGERRPDHGFRISSSPGSSFGCRRPRARRSADARQAPGLGGSRSPAAPGERSLEPSRGSASSPAPSGPSSTRCGARRRSIHLPGWPARACRRVTAAPGRRLGRGRARWTSRRRSRSSSSGSRARDSGGSSGSTPRARLPSSGAPSARSTASPATRRRRSTGGSGSSSSRSARSPPSAPTRPARPSR